MIGTAIGGVAFFNPQHSAAAKARELARQLLIQNTGETVFLLFVKRDGSLRSMRGQLGVADHLADPVNGDPQAADTPELITVFDVDVKGYRRAPRQAFPCRRSLRCSTTSRDIAAWA